MENAVLSSFQYNNIPDDYDPCFGIDECGFMDLLSSVFGQEHTIEKKAELDENEAKVLSDDWMDHDFCQDVIPREIEADTTPEFIDKPHQVSLPSWELLNSSNKGLKMPKEVETNYPRKKNGEGAGLSTEEIMKIAGERFIQFATNRVDGISMFLNPYGPSLLGLSIDQARDVELVHVLLTAAENVGRGQFDLANKMISRSLHMGSDSGTPIQRIAFYFAEALREKVRREFGRITNENKQEPEIQRKQLALGTNNTFLATHQKLPFIQVMQFAGIQAVIENVKTTEKIHLIDLQIRSGIQWTALMQGLADFQIQHLKITAIGTVDQLFIEETGKRLLSFAQSLNLPFSFKAVYLTDMRDFKEDLLNIQPDETVAFYSYLMLRSMLSKPDCLENLMREIARCKPLLMVVTEVEANTNSPSFVDRFVEALFFYSVFFDCLEDFLEREDPCRIALEGAYSYEGIMNIVAAEGHERITRDVKIDVWRAFLARFGMTEIELSESSRYQASLVLKQFAQGSSCTIDYNGKSLIVGWKGTPVHSLTIWKFSH